MLVVDIDKRYHVRDTWSDVTLSDAIAIHGMFGDMPNKVREVYISILEGDVDAARDIYMGLTDEEMNKVFPDWYAAVIAALSDIPLEVLLKTDAMQRTSLYTIHLEPLVVALMRAPGDYPVKEIKHFDHHGVRYYLPEKGMVLGGDGLPGVKLTAVQYAQSADLMARLVEMDRGGWALMANVISILCLPKGEKYDEQTSLKRADVFEDLPMSVVWEVYFFIYRSLTRLSVSILHSLMEAVEAEKGRKRQRRPVFRRGAGMDNYWGRLEMTS